MCARRENAGMYVGVLGGLALLLAVGCAGSDLDQHKDNPTGQMPDVVGKWTINCSSECSPLQVDIRPDHTVKVAGSPDGNWQMRNDGTLVLAEFMVTIGGKTGGGSFWAPWNPTPGASLKGSLQRCAGDCDQRMAEAVRGWQ